MTIADPPLSIGEFAGPYYLGSLLHETPTAFIYESYNPESCAKLALKFLKKRGRNPQIIEDECGISCEVKSEFVLNAFEVFDLPDYRCIVFPFAAGGDLLDFILDTGPLPEAVACKIFFSALSAVYYLHSIGIWHRDIKPENILLMEWSLDDPRVVLADFGVSGRFGADEIRTEVVGSLKYRAPEMISGEGYNQQVDMWGLGVVLFEMLARESPWPDQDCESAILECAFEMDGAVWSEVSEEAKDLIGLLLQTEPRNRLSAEEVLDHPWFEIKFPEHEKARLVRETQKKLGVVEELAIEAVFFLEEGETF